MKNNLSKKDKSIVFLQALLFVLVIIFAVCIIVKKNGSKVESIETALVNPKYINNISEIEIRIPKDGNRSVPIDKTVTTKSVSIEYENILLSNHGTLWTGKSSEQDGAEWPVSKTTVENLIGSSTNIIKMYKKSDNIKNWQSLSVTESTAKTLIFKGKDGSYISQLYFGVENPITNRVSVRSAARQSVYEMDQSIMNFMTTQSSFWCDPYLYPQYVTGLNNSEISSFLRHGQISAVKEITEKPVQLVKKSFGNGAEVLLKIYKQTTNDYYVVPTFSSSVASGYQERNAISSLSYSYTISAWTYEKLIEEN
ncbi:MAG: hypothetical protein WCQ67_04640 [Treponema sp.]